MIPLLPFEHINARFSAYSATSAITTQQITDLESLATALLTQSVSESRTVAGAALWDGYKAGLNVDNAFATITGATDGTPPVMSAIFYLGNLTTPAGYANFLKNVAGLLTVAIGDATTVAKLLGILKILGQVCNLGVAAPISSKAAGIAIQNFLKVLYNLPVANLYGTQL